MARTSRSFIRCIPLLACCALLGACGGSSKGVASDDGGLPGAGGSGPGQGGALAGGGGVVGTGGVGPVDGGLLPGSGGSTVPACGAPGTPCCNGNGCDSGGCCVSGICLSAGGVCVGLGGGLCNAGACGSCGGAGLSCCGANPATGACTAAGTACNAGICTKCGELGSLCCPSAAGGTGTCNGESAICTGNVCLACGTPGSPCCPGSRCASPGCCYDNLCTAEGNACGASGGTCQAGRCSGCGGVNQVCCAASTCYDGLLCKGGTCTPCGGLAQACCPSGTGASACQAGTTCISSGADSVCARCGSLGDTCCAGNVCSEGCCSGGRCMAPGSPGCPTGTPDAGGAPDAPVGGSGGTGGAGGAGGAGGQLGAGGVVGTGGNSVPTGGAGGTTIPWTIPAGCGDGVVTPPEQCDDVNTMPFDGCSSDCKREPLCNGIGPCTSTCGDGLVVGEECDDGNLTNGDGCSSGCKVEGGFHCVQPDPGGMIRVPVVYRDFRFKNPSDFEAGVTGSEKASTGMVKSALDSEGKPVFTGLTGTAIHVASVDTFATWYRTSSSINHATPSVMALYDNGAGAYVNRYGANGELWPITETAIWCGNVGTEALDTSGNPIPCTYQYASSTIQTDCDKALARGEQMLKCTNDGGIYRGLFLIGYNDGNPLFFPVDGDSFTPSSERMSAQIPPLYLNGATTWPYDVDDAGIKRPHNFSFTSEIRYWFKFDAARSFQLNIIGDDDVWVFVNKQLAVDLGGIHTPVQGSVTLDATAATKFGLTDGSVYEVAVFQAERQSTSSTLKITLSGFNTAPSQCFRD